MIKTTTNKSRVLNGSITGFVILVSFIWIPRAIIYWIKNIFIPLESS
jgi:hypothetical protein